MTGADLEGGQEVGHAGHHLGNSWHGGAAGGDVVGAVLAHHNDSLWLRARRSCHRPCAADTNNS